jgi:O-antigen/teichoic acid export membrane protein
MRKPPLHPLRLIPVSEYQSKNNALTGKSTARENTSLDENPTSHLHLIPTIETPRVMPLHHSKTRQAQRDSEAQRLLKRTPNNYLFSQAFGLWLYISLFLISLILTHTVSTAEYGTYAAIMTLSNTITYIVALGLEDAMVTFFSRVSLERGETAAARLIRQILLLRITVLAVCVCIIMFGLPVLAQMVRWLPIQEAKAISTSLQDPVLLGHSRPIALYVLGTGITNLLQAVCAAQMRMIRVLIVSGLTQLGLVIFGFVVLYLGWGIDGVLWMQAIITLLGACAFLLWLSPLLVIRAAADKQPLKPVLHVGFSAWLTNLASGALFKQVSIALLTIYAVSLADIGYFNLSFQLADAANVLLVSGFSGVGASALAASFVGNNYERLGHSWQSLIKVETLLAAPGLVFCLFNAQNIAIALYGSKFAAVGPLLTIFLAFNLLYRIIGTPMHQCSLYVIGKPHTVVISQWLGLLLIIVIGIMLVPRFGPAGALMADGIAKALTGIFMLGFLLGRFPRKYPLGILNFTLRFLLALTIAALPGLFWHPLGLVQLVLAGALFLTLCLGTLLFIKPLSSEDLEMIAAMKPSLARYIRWFSQK